MALFHSACSPEEWHKHLTALPHLKCPFMGQLPAAVRSKVEPDSTFLDGSLQRVGRKSPQKLSLLRRLGEHEQTLPTINSSIHSTHLTQEPSCQALSQDLGSSTEDNEVPTLMELTFLCRKTNDK